MNRRVLPVTAFIFLVYAAIIGRPGPSFGDDSPMTPEELVKSALEVSLSMKSRAGLLKEREFEEAIARSNFYPSFKATYTYEQERHASYILNTLTDPEDDYTFAVSFVQQIYNPKALSLSLDIARLDREKAECLSELERRNVVINVITTYYTLLKARRRAEIVSSQVMQIAAHEEKSRAFYEAGKISYNDLLQASVRLADARFEAVSANNSVALAEAQLNILLRRPSDAALHVVEQLDDAPFSMTPEECRNLAMKNRIEINLAEMDVKKTRTAVKTAEVEYYPTINLNGFYYKKGTHPDTHDTSGLYYPEEWQVKAVLEWTIWSGGKRPNQVAARKAVESQASFTADQLRDAIMLEIREAYLKMTETYTNIGKMDETVGQAEENLRLYRGRFDHLLAASTDVLDAEALLTAAKGRYTSALYDYMISKALLKHAMGLDVMAPVSNTSDINDKHK